MSYSVGQSVIRSETVRDVNGAVTNAPTITAVLTAPDGTTSAPTVTNTAAGGIYTVPLTFTTQAGAWLLQFTGTGGIVPPERQFNVRARGARLLSLDDVKTQIGASTITNDDELYDYLDAVTDAVEYVTGPMVRRTITAELVDTTGGSVALACSPVISVTTIVAAQTGYTAPLITDLILDKPSGILYPAYGGYRWWGPLLVTYIAGRAVIPASVNVAARIILQHLWETQHNRAAGRPAGFGGDELALMPGLGFAVPNRAVELLELYRGAPAVA